MSPDGVWRAGMSVPFEAEKLTVLCCYIALGLAWHHWQILIAPSAFANASSFTAEGTRHFVETWDTLDAGGRTSGNLGTGTFEYRGLYSRTNPKVTFWQMSFFGGAELGDTFKRGETTRSVFVGTSDAPEWVAKYDANRAVGRAPIGLG